MPRKLSMRLSSLSVLQPLHARNPSRAMHRTHPGATDRPRSRGRLGWLAGVISVVVVLAGCGSASTPSPVASSAQVTVRDCHRSEVTFSETPRRVVTLDGYAAQVLARLGLADRIVGTGYPAPFGVEKEPYRHELNRVPVLSSTVLTTEAVAAQRPDLVLTGFSAFGGPPGSPKDSDLQTMGTRGLAACMPGDMSGMSGMSGGMSGPPLQDLSSTYEFLLKLGKVFRVEDRAQKVVADLRAREKAVVARAGSGRKPRVLVLQDNPVGGQPVKTSGTGTIAHALIGEAGGQDIFSDVTSMHADVSPETVVQRDPEIIWVITDYTFARVKGPELVRQVKANPLLASTTALKEGRVVSTSQYLVSFPTPLNLDGLEQLAADLRAGGS